MSHWHYVGTGKLDSTDSQSRFDESEIDSRANNSFQPRLHLHVKTPNKVELILIPVAVGAVCLAGSFLPARLDAAELLVVACLAWLVQGGIRDLWYLWRLKSQPAARPRRELACMCLESSAGLTGVLFGVVGALCSLGGELILTTGRWTSLAAGVLTLGFLLKDFMITWRPLGIRRELDHHSIVFAFSSPKIRRINPPSVLGPKDLQRTRDRRIACRRCSRN